MRRSWLYLAMRSVRAGGAGLDLAGGVANGEFGDEGVFGFAGTVGDDGVVAGFAGELDGVDGYRDAAI